MSSTISATSLQELGRWQIFKLCLHHNHDECCMLWRWGWLWYRGCWCWQRSWIVDQTKSNQISEIVLTNEKWRCVKDALKRRQFPQIGRRHFLTNLYHPLSRLLSNILSGTYISDTGTHIQDTYNIQETDTDINRHKLSVLFPVWLSVTFSKVYSLAHTETQAHINTHPNTQACVYIIKTTIDQVWFSVSLSAMKRWRKT